MDFFDQVYQELKKALPELELRQNEPMSAHTSLRIGGPARLMALPKNMAQLRAAERAAENYDIPAVVVGNGTNLLAPDEGLEALIIKLTPGLDYLHINGDVITAGAGTLLSKVAQEAQKHGLSGLEFAHGIPGSLGGAITMNAGAYGGEMKDVVVDVEYIDLVGEEKVRRGADLEFSYRSSAFSRRLGVITGARLQLTPGDPEEIRRRMNELAEKRRASQPLDLPSAGSAFKRPKDGYAAELIDRAGLKGMRVGGAMVSEKHAGFIVNAGGATAQDVRTLIGIIQQTVFEMSGVELEPEIRIL